MSIFAFLVEDIARMKDSMGDPEQRRILGSHGVQCFGERIKYGTELLHIAHGKPSNEQRPKD